MGPRNLDIQKAPWLTFLQPGHRQRLENTASITHNNLCLPSYSCVKHRLRRAELQIAPPTASWDAARPFTPVYIPEEVPRPSRASPGSSSLPPSAPSSLLTCPPNDFTAHFLGTAHPAIISDPLIHYLLSLCQALTLRETLPT